MKSPLGRDNSVFMGTEPTREFYLDSIDTVREGLKRRFRSSFFGFAVHCLGYDFLPHVHGDLCEALQLAYWGQGDHDVSGGIHRILALMPRGSFKTSLVTQAWPAWILTQNDPPDPFDPSYRPAWEPPRSFNGKKGYDQRILLGQEVDDNVAKFLGAIKELFQRSPMLLEIFGNLAPTDRRQNKNIKWTNDAINVSWRQDYRTKDFNVGTCSLTSAANSTHCDIVVADDIFGEKQVQSEAGLQSTVDFYRRLIPIADNPAIVVFVGTRWHDNDLYGHFLESEGEKGKWQVFQESVERTEDEIAAGKAPIFFPERFTAAVIADKKSTMRPTLWHAQYNNRPVDEETALFKPSYFVNSYYDLPIQPMLDDWLANMVIITTADPANSEEPDACDATILTCAWDQNGHVWTLDLYAERGPSPGEYIDELFRHYTTWNPIQIGVEKDKLQKNIMFYANQQSQLTQVWPPFKDLKHGGRAKPLRISALEGVARAGRIHLRRGHESIENEFIRYPKGRTDDRIDALAYQLDLAYMPFHREAVREETHVVGTTRYILPDEMAVAWRNHQIRLGIHKPDPYQSGTSGLSWKQL